LSHSKQTPYFPVFPYAPGPPWAKLWGCHDLPVDAHIFSLGHLAKTDFRSIIGFMLPPAKQLCRAFLIFAVAAIFTASAVAKNFAKPQAQPAKTYPAHDDHTDEKVAIAADPYDTSEKAKIFSINFHDHGFLPVFFVITNNGSQPVSITNMQVTLTTANNSKLTPASPDDIYRRLVNPHGGTRPEMPLPFPRSKVKGAITDKERNEVESSQFAARAVEPNNTQSGFFFFDIEDISAPLAGAHLYVTGVDDANGTELMYFDISMDNYLDAAH
jgi:hypothetical protein